MPWPLLLPPMALVGSSRTLLVSSPVSSLVTCRTFGSALKLGRPPFQDRVPSFRFLLDSRTSSQPLAHTFMECSACPCLCPCVYLCVAMQGGP
eukprot:4923225-Amphidinium_carterae.1